ncbi:MAG: DUF4282 domain-containing protein [Cyanophyceae cyanobacterium]
MTQPRGFFRSLFDFSFSHFVAIKVVGVLYAVGIFFAALFAFVVVTGGFNRGFLSGVGSLIVAPLIFLLYIIFIRISLEALVAGIRTAENTARIAENMQLHRTELP